MLTNTTDYNNSAVGYNSLIFNTTGYNNSALGRNTLQNNTTGLNNTALGTYSMFGSTNIAVGRNALLTNTTDYNNSAVGYNSLIFNTTGYTSEETARAAMAFARKHLGDKPVTAIVFTHSHVDHFGVRWVCSAPRKWLLAMFL
ncbi:MBL fold metallo-hydrolase [Mycobacterium tuberculosis]|uniref:MBL fold metallo-hydrolase n=1 Tax=Mycobacterium tuberculosis TaxID=1773 RepID=UPI00272B045E|nr:MBL fold metallo-hydrolase [Mycobacterium tuberculosis]